MKDNKDNNSIIELRPWQEYELLGSNIRKWKTPGKTATKSIERVYFTELFELERISKNKITLSISTIFFRNPILEVFNNKSADITQFKGKV